MEIKRPTHGEEGHVKMEINFDDITMHRNPQDTANMSRYKG